MCQNVIIKNNQTGVEINSNANLYIKGATITANTYDGAYLARSSYAEFENSTISANGKNGIWIGYSSSGRIWNCSVNNNTHNGIALFTAASLELVGNTIFGNKFSGVHVSRNSAADLRGGNKIYNNNDMTPWRGGISLAHGGHATIGDNNPVAAKDQIYNNNGQGIFVGSQSDLFLAAGSVYGNQLDGVCLRWDSSAQFESGSRVYANKGFGVRCADKDGDSKILGAVGYCGSASSGDLNTLGCNNCMVYY